MELPRIKIEVERMKYQILHAFQNHDDEIEKVVEAELTKAIETYPFEDEIYKVAQETISEVVSRSVKDYFSYGEGYQLIQDIIHDAIQKKVKR